MNDTRIAAVRCAIHSLLFRPGGFFAPKREPTPLFASQEPPDAVDCSQAEIGFDSPYLHRQARGLRGWRWRFASSALTTFCLWLGSGPTWRLPPPGVANGLFNDTTAAKSTCSTLEWGRHCGRLLLQTCKKVQNLARTILLTRS